MEDKKYIKKLENEIKWLTRRERYTRNSLSLLIEMVEELLTDATAAECPSFNEILNDMKARDLREPWQVKIQQQPIEGAVGGSKLKVSIKTKPAPKTKTPKKAKAPKKAKKSKRGRKSNVAKKTKKAMKTLKKNKRSFTHSVYGWNTKKDGTIVPNWKEQNRIDWMSDQLYVKGRSASSIARELVKAGVVGKKGGTWTSSSVLRTVRNDFHETRKMHKAPKWFTDRKDLKL